MARQWFRGYASKGVAAGLLWGVFMVADRPPAEARMGGVHGSFHAAFGTRFHGGFHAGFGHRFHHGFHHSFRHHFFVHGFHGPFKHNFFHPFHRNVFFFNVGVGGFFPVYPVAYPYPAYYPYYYPYYYSPCGYYDAYGTWINAPCPPYAPPVSAPQQWSPPAGVFTPPAQPGEGGQGTQSPGY